MNKRILCVEFETDPGRGSIKFKEALRAHGFALVEKTDAQIKDDHEDKNFILIVLFGLNPNPYHFKGLAYLEYLAEVFPGVPRLSVTGHEDPSTVNDITKRGAHYVWRGATDADFVRRVAVLTNQ